MKANKIKIDDNYNLVIKNIDISANNESVYAYVFKKGEKSPLYGTTFSKRSTIRQIEEWATSIVKKRGCKALIEV